MSWVQQDQELFTDPNLLKLHRQVMMELNLTQQLLEQLNQQYARDRHERARINAEGEAQLDAALREESRDIINEVNAQPYRLAVRDCGQAPAWSLHLPVVQL